MGFFLIFPLLLLCQDGTTPLMMASAAGHIECCRELISQGADPTLRRKVSTSIITLFFYVCVLD